MRRGQAQEEMKSRSTKIKETWPVVLQGNVEVPTLEMMKVASAALAQVRKIEDKSTEQRRSADACIRAQDLKADDKQNEDDRQEFELGGRARRNQHRKTTSRSHSRACSRVALQHRRVDSISSRKHPKCNPVMRPRRNTS